MSTTTSTTTTTTTTTTRDRGDRYGSMEWAQKSNVSHVALVHTEYPFSVSTADGTPGVHGYLHN